MSNKESKAKAIIDSLLDRAGFDHWWDDIDDSDKKEIINDITKIIEAD